MNFVTAVAIVAVIALIVISLPSIVG